MFPRLRVDLMCRTLIVILCMFSLSLARAQLLDRIALDSVTAFTDLDVALQQPEKVFSLDLSGQKLKEVPASISRFTNLNILDLSRNKLKEIPSFIGNMNSLQELRLSKNKLKEFPLGVCELENLDHLDFGKNGIDSIPSCIGRLQKLRVLDLWGNFISSFPDEMMDLKALRFVDLRVMVLSFEEIDRIEEMIPWAKVYYSEPCNCN